MPGRYIHMEAAKLAAQRLAAGQVPPDYGIAPAEAQRLGGLCHKWRNYLALGALGPDLFYLLPDFKKPVGGPLFGVADRGVHRVGRGEDQFLGPWEKFMGPVGANDQQLASDLTGGLSRQLGQAMDAIAGAITNAALTG